MIHIPLTKGCFALIDDDEFDTVSMFKWHLHPSGYARMGYRVEGRVISASMHRFIMWEPLGMQVDHINRNKLDNRKENLRLATNGQNKQNGLRYASNTSGYKGVHWHKQAKAFRARISVDGVRRHLGDFRTAEEAGRAYLEAASRLHGEFFPVALQLGKQ